MTDFAAVVTALRTERDTLAARVEALTQAIEVIGKLHGATPAPAADVKQRAPAKAARADGTAGDDNGARILAALRKHGAPMRPGELQADLELSSYLLSKALEELRTKRLVVITGASSGKRVSLPATPAKEAP